MRLFQIKLFIITVLASLSLATNAQTITDINEPRDVDWGDERNYQDDFSPYAEGEYLPQEQLEYEDPVEYDDAYFDDVDLIQEDRDYDYYGEEFDYYDTDEGFYEDNEGPYIDTSL